MRSAGSAEVRVGAADAAAIAAQFLRNSRLRIDLLEIWF
jgi:hypothetical protein